MQLLQLLKHIKSEISANYDANEAEAISYLILEHFGFSKTDIIINSDVTVDQSQLEGILVRLKNNEPLQYILGNGWFYNRKFEVNPSTLIPRIETEELVHLILSNNKEKRALRVLDIGTGTGCIPITLFLENSLFEVSGIDISEKAIEIANQNATKLNAKVNFFVKDIFTISNLEGFDIVVSNPPYVTNAEKNLMNENVLNYEPHTALFVEDENPLLFYKIIAELAGESSTIKQLYFEINEQFGEVTRLLLLQNGFNSSEIVKDMQRKDRMVFGFK